MPTHRTEVAHALGRAEAVARLKAYTGLSRGYTDLKGTWEGSTFTFTVSMQGFRVGGTVQVEEDHLKLESEAPGHAPMFATWLPRMAQMALMPQGAFLGQGPGGLTGPAPKADPAAGQDAAPTVLFLHVPKAGGHTLAEHIVEQCSAGDFRDESGTLSAGVLSLQYGFFKDADLDAPAHVRPLLRRPDLRAVLGHFAFGIHRHLTRPWTYITVLRDPVDRVVSMYYFLKLQERMSLEEFAASPPFREMDNDQTRRIAGTDPELGALTRATLETAKENLRRHFSAMGTVERFEETLVLLNRRLGWTREVASTPRNVTRERKPVSALPASTVEAIRRWNELDVELHRFADEWMDQAIAEEGPAFHDDLARRRGLASAARG